MPPTSVPPHHIRPPVRAPRSYSYPDRLKDTTENLLTILKWRREHGLSTLCQRSLPHEGLVHKSWPSVVYGEDYLGHVLNVEKLKDIDTDSLLTGGASLDEILLVMDQCLHDNVGAKGSEEEEAVASPASGPMSHSCHAGCARRP